MSLTVFRILLALGIAGHAINLYCDRILCVFPNGKLMLSNMKDIKEDGKMAKLMEGVSEKVPMRSAVLGAFALFLQFLGYFSIAAYIYEHSRAAGAVMFFSLSFFIIIGTAHHVKTALMEYVFLKLDRDERGKNLMLDMLNSAPVTRICFLGYIVFVITLIVAIVTGIATFPIWAVIFTVLPVFILLFPFRIIGTLHISAMISMLVWMFLL